MKFTLRIINRFSNDPGALVDVPLSCGRIRATLAALAVLLLTGKGVALLRGSELLFVWEGRED